MAPVAPGVWDLVKAPLSGQYPIFANAPGWRAVGNSLTPGYGPTQYLGAFDTRPELPAYQPAAIRNLKPIPAPGGATLRWATPRPFAVGNTDGQSWLQGPGIYGACLTLYVASFDVLPVGRQWRSDEQLSLVPYDDCPWPGRFADSDATGSDSILVDWTATQQFGAAGSDAVAQDDAQRYLGRNLAKPGLDLLAYSGRVGWSEADLLELGGGARYVVAWLKFHYVRYAQGADQFAEAQYYMPWSITAGRAVDACHRNRWACGYILTPETSASPASVDLTRYFIGAPFAARQWIIGAMNNSNNVGDVDVTLTIEQRSSTTWLQDSITVEAGTPTFTYGGAAGGALNLIPSYTGGDTGVILVGVEALR